MKHREDLGIDDIKEGSVRDGRSNGDLCTLGEVMLTLDGKGSHGGVAKIIRGGSKS